MTKRVLRFAADDFDAWRHSPMTEFILDRFIDAEMKETREAHTDAAWNGPLSPDAHARYRERFETLQFLKQLTFEEIEARERARQEADDS